MNTFSAPAGLTCAILTGLEASAMNFGLAFGGPMVGAARRR
ncbi:MAG TPA: hypothetical protein VMU62_05460 [Acidobacteriaceae bacterium]|nr:hypothetical protein [Acidobacteriaceae bacterium]